VSKLAVHTGAFPLHPTKAHFFPAIGICHLLRKRRGWNCDIATLVRESALEFAKNNKEFGVREMLSLQERRVVLALLVAHGLDYG
jgi:hypothetical protein